MPYKRLRVAIELDVPTAEPEGDDRSRPAIAGECLDLAAAAT